MTKSAFRSFVLCTLAATFSLPIAAQSADQGPLLQDNSTAQPTKNAAERVAQNTPAPPDTDRAKPDQTKSNQDPQIPAPTKNAPPANDRIGFALPNYLTVENGGPYVPLTSGQKFHIVARGAFDYIQIPWFGLLSAISQAEDSEPAYGQGWGGYGKRLATTAADGTIENFMVGALLPSVLHQDPRFFQSGEGGFSHRAWYAVSRIVVTKNDSGHSQFNYSEVFGSALSASISTYSYHPRSTILSTPTGPRFIGSDRTLANTASVWGSQVGYDTITLVVKEFWPDIHRKIVRKRHADSNKPLSNP